MPQFGPWQAGSLKASYKRLKAWFNSKKVYMNYTKTQWESFPVDRNCEMITCQYCENETAVQINDFITKYTCPVCYSVPRLNKRKTD